MFPNPVVLGIKQPLPFNLEGRAKRGKCFQLRLPIDTFPVCARQANWKLDPPLRKACRGDVGKMCVAEDGQNSEDGLVYKCLVKNFADLATGCQKEMGRAVHMAFYVWQPAAILTTDCDEDIQQMCLSQRPNMASRPGAVGTCLAGIVSFHAAWGSCSWPKP